MESLDKPNLPASLLCQAEAIVCKSLLNVKNNRVLKQGLVHLKDLLASAEPFMNHAQEHDVSVLLREYAHVCHLSNPLQSHSTQAPPLLQKLSAVQAIVNIFIHAFKVGQGKIRATYVNHWGCNLGLHVLKLLSNLYLALMRETSVLIALSRDSSIPAETGFGEDIQRGIAFALNTMKDVPSSAPLLEGGLLRQSELGSSVAVSSAMGSLSATEIASSIEIDISTGAEMSKSMHQKSRESQLRLIKPLLTVSSQLGRSLAELLGLLVKVSVGSWTSQRNMQAVSPIATADTEAAYAIALALCSHLADGLRSLPDYHLEEEQRLRCVTHVVDLTSAMLFDKTSRSYLLMRQKFVECGGQEELLQAFWWALSPGGEFQVEDELESPEVPEGSGEFLDAWLLLIEKMSNPKSILESPYLMPAKPSQSGLVPFNPLAYIFQTQKVAFNAVTHLWNQKPLKVYGARMSESLLNILFHIINSEALIEKKQLDAEREADKPANQEAAGGAAITKAAAAATEKVASESLRDEPNINEEFLTQMVDLGFSREHAIQALLHYNNLEEATEYYLSHMSPTLPLPVPVEMDLNIDMLSEEDQMTRAISLSLNEDVPFAPDEQPPGMADEEESDESWKELIDSFTHTMIPGCLRLLDAFPESVYRVSRLILLLNTRNGMMWLAEALMTLVSEIIQLCEHSVKVALNPPNASELRTIIQTAKQLTSTPEYSKLAIRVQLLTIIAKELRSRDANFGEEDGIIDLLNRLMPLHSAPGEVTMPQLMTSLLLVMDSCQRATIAKQASRLDKGEEQKNTWKWFDSRLGIWFTYSESVNRAIDEAYLAQRPTIRFAEGKKKFVIEFADMMQVEEKTDKCHAIMFCDRSTEIKKDTTAEATAADADQGQNPAKKKRGHANQPTRSSKRRKNNAGQGEKSSEADKATTAKDLDLKTLSDKQHVIFFDWDNWSNHLDDLLKNTSARTFIWLFFGGTNSWKEPVKSEAYRKAKADGRIHVQKQCDNVKDASDFAICLWLGIAHREVGDEIPFTILSADREFEEIENQLLGNKRTVVAISPHHVNNVKLSTLLKSVYERKQVKI